MNKDELENLKKFLRLTNYISAIQTYLKENYLLKEPLRPEHIKPRLLGHWGTCPGINLVYAHLNLLIKKTGSNFLFVLGPGHGFPALQANIYLEGTLRKYYPEATLDEKGLGYVAKNFSWPYGFPSHSSPATPGVIVEGGELGYSLSTSYGAVLDQPHLIVACLVGDGEAETASTATAWHLHKFIDPKSSGAVLPILHLNGYKISGPTIFGRMSKTELKNLFKGYGYDPVFVSAYGDEDKIHESLARAMTDAHLEIRRIQSEAKDGTGKNWPAWPMIILSSPKGATGIKKRGKDKIEDNCLSHQVTLPNAKNDKKDLVALDKWLRSYRVEELFDPINGPLKELMGLVPEEKLLMGDNRIARLGVTPENELDLPDVSKYISPKTQSEKSTASSMIQMGKYLNELFTKNSEKKNFRLMSPDETYSNKLDAVFESTTRAWNGPLKSWDKDIAPEGRVIEMLSENSLQGMAQGYILTGRHAIFASYEAFVQVVSSMADQYAKFLKIARETSWREPVASLIYVLTSSGWRQDHNGFSHQNPGFIDGVLERHGRFARVFFPADANSTLTVLHRSLKTKNEIHVICAAKTEETIWLNKEEAEEEAEAGLSIWKFASDEDPDIVFGAAGDYLTGESLAAIQIVKQEIPNAKIRFVNVLELCATNIGSSSNHHPLEEYFTSDKPVIFNFHGYPETFEQRLFDWKTDLRRFTVHGYLEIGSTSTPFDLQLRNSTSRWHLALDAFRSLEDQGKLDADTARSLYQKYLKKIASYPEYVKEHGVDSEEITNWKWHI
ncbi:MAG: phosphoketolase family protein [Candidatus Vogelbacteria bacterium]|nr:phosphoketolase family protein [Candidatus Vogelbacteria bacterium]